jgi:hypothetical protein
LPECLDDTSSVRVDTGEVLALALTALEDTIDVCGGCIVGATNTVVDVLAEVRAVLAGWVTGFDTEDITAHEVVPFDNLLERILLAAIAGEGIAEHQTTKWVSSLIGTVGIEFTSRITCLDVDEVLSDVAGNLDIILCAHELDASEGPGGDKTRTATWLGAPGDRFTFGVTDD